MDRPRRCRDSVNDTYYDYSHTPPSPLRLCLLQGVGGGGGQGQGQGSAKGARPLWTLPLESPSVPKAPKPWEPMFVVHDCLCLEPSSTGVPSGTSGSTGFRGGWVSGGARLVLESWALTSPRWPGQCSSAQGWGQAGQRGNHQVGRHHASS